MKPSDPARLCLVLFFLLLLFCAGAVLRDLTFPDELRYAEVSREMLETGNWTLPAFNYEIYYEKPPVFFWLLALSMHLFGPHTLSVLLPSILSALLTVLFTYLLGRQVFDRHTAIIGVWVLGTTLMFAFMAQVARMDMTLTLLVTASLYFLWPRLRGKTGPVSRTLAAYFCIGVAMITKGPVGPVLIAVTVAGYLWAAKSMKRLKTLDLGWGVLLMAGIPLAWLIPAGLEGGGDYIRKLVLDQSLGRIAGSFTHSEPSYYYLIHFFWIFVPWSFFLLLSLDAGIRDDLSKHRDGMFLVVSWIAGSLIFFTLMREKIVIYLLPLTPAMALLVARSFSPLVKDPATLRNPLFFKLPAFLFGALCLGGAAALFSMELRITALNEWFNLFPAILVLVLGGAALFYHGHKLQIIGSLVTPGLVSLILAGSITLWTVPRINADLSLRPLARRILAIQARNPSVAGYRLNLPYLTFYLHTPYDELGSILELKNYVQKDRVFLVVRSREASGVKEAISLPYVEVGRFQIKGISYLLFLTGRAMPADISNMDIG